MKYKVIVEYYNPSEGFSGVHCATKYFESRAKAISYIKSKESNREMSFTIEEVK